MSAARGAFPIRSPTTAATAVSREEEDASRGDPVAVEGAPSAATATAAAAAATAAAAIRAPRTGPERRWWGRASFAASGGSRRARAGVAAVMAAKDATALEQTS